jgi:hypothetical protein
MQPVKYVKKKRKEFIQAIVKHKSTTFTLLSSAMALLAMAASR